VVDIAIRGSSSTNRIMAERLICCGAAAGVSASGADVAMGSTMVAVVPFPIALESSSVPPS